MTTISDIGASKIDHEERRPRVEGRRFSLALLVGTSAIVVTAINLAATIYIYRSVRDLHVIDQRLEQLKTFEQRIANGLDTMNMGVQNRFETLNGDLQGQLGQLHKGIARLESSLKVTGSQSLDVLAPAGTEIAIEHLPEVSDLADEPEAEIEAQVEPAVPHPELATRKQSTKRQPPASSAYERIQSADGKVHYRKVR